MHGCAPIRFIVRDAAEDKGRTNVGSVEPSCPGGACSAWACYEIQMAMCQGDVRGGMECVVSPRWPCVRGSMGHVVEACSAGLLLGQAHALAQCQGAGCLTGRG